MITPNDSVLRQQPKAKAPLLCAIVAALATLLPPAVAADNTSSMPLHREGGASRDGCQARRVVHLVPTDSRFTPAQAGRIAILEGPAPRPTRLQVRLLSQGEWTLPAQSAGIRLITLGPISKDLLWESSPFCDLAADANGAPPARSLLLQRSSSHGEQAASRRVEGLLQELASRCGASVDTDSVLRGFNLEHLRPQLPAQLPLWCGRLGSSTAAR